MLEKQLSTELKVSDTFYVLNAEFNVCMQETACIIITVNFYQQMLISVCTQNYTTFYRFNTCLGTTYVALIFRTLVTIRIIIF